MRRNTVRSGLIVALLAGLLCGCAVYHAEPLPAAPDVAPSAPSGPLDMTKAARLALKASPDLAALRRQAEVTEATADVGGLLPDPQVSLSGDRPTIHGVGLTNAYALGLSQDLQALLTEPSRAEGAEAARKEAALNLLWEEWQTIQSASGAYVTAYFSATKAAQLHAAADVLSAQASRSTRALATHDSTIDAAGADLSAALDTASQADNAAREALSADAALKALLNVAPSATLSLADPGLPAPIAKNALGTALAHVAEARPDLLALKAGYHAQEEAVWTAILEQFPAINVGFNRASDTSNIQTNGLAVTLNLPIFGTTQANIRKERATRAQLRAEYQARLDATVSDAWRIWHALGLLHAQLESLSAQLPQLRKMAQAGQRAYRAGNLPSATYVLMMTSLATREAELFDLKTTLWTDTLALRTLLATPLVTVEAGDGR
ncbi:MAG: TolC family protein [Alphaproteobacteria bacterium]|nr:TolC family protein [Alphaproteobacteria bacterium]